MAHTIDHHRFFLHALRTALIFIVGFISYELLKELEKEWNSLVKGMEPIHFAQRKAFHFLLLFATDLLMLYSIAFVFQVTL